MYYGQLTRVDPNNGTWWRLGNGAEWNGSACMATLGGHLYIVQGSALVRASPADGTWEVVGDGNAWGGSVCMAALGGHLYIVQNAALVRADPFPPQGSRGWDVVGNGDEWAGSSCMAALGDRLYIVQGSALVRANPVDGTWEIVGDANAWGGSVCMAALGGHLYIVQNASLVRADPVPAPGSRGWDVVGNGDEWGGSLGMAAEGGHLYVTQGPHLVRASPDPANPGWNVVSSGPDWFGASCVSAHDGAIFVVIQEASTTGSWNRQLTATNIRISDFEATRSVGELEFELRSVGGWRFLGDPPSLFPRNVDMDGLATLLMTRSDQRDYWGSSLFRGFGIEPGNLPNLPLQTITDNLSARLAGMSPGSRAALADNMIAEHENILNDVAAMALRRIPTNGIPIVAAVGVVEAAGHRSGELARLRLDCGYTDLLCGALERGDMASLIRVLPDLADASVPLAERTSLFDMLRRWEVCFLALDTVLADVGKPSQQADMARFLGARAEALRTFPETSPAVIGAISAKFEAIANEIAGLRDALGAIAESVSSISVFSLLDMLNDDRARKASHALESTGRVGFLPTGYKLALVNAMLDGTTGDEDEQGILTNMRAARARSLAELMQLSAGATWARLSDSVNGSERDEMLKLYAV